MKNAEEEFSIIIEENGSPKLKPVWGKRVNVGEYKAFVFLDNGLYNVTSLELGMFMARQSTKQKAVSKAAEGLQTLMHIANENIQRLTTAGISFPINK